MVSPESARTYSDLDLLRDSLISKEATVGVIGLGYVGLPLAQATGRAGYCVIGFDVDDERVRQISNGNSHVSAVDGQSLKALADEGLFTATADFKRLSEVDVTIICVPTPITAQREPDLSYVTAATESIAAHLRPGQLIVLESTTWPGTTIEVVRPILERRGLRSGIDFYLAFSPEREDPGNAHYETTTIPKVVGGDGEAALELAALLYERIVNRVVRTTSTQTAEAVKLTENIFRAVNIALVNELKLVFQPMGIDIWEVIEAAKSKPFGFMPFYPGPGLGGHCIPIDPFYLTWKAREYDISTHFIELAGEINSSMPRYVLGRLSEELDSRFSAGLNGANILLVGVAYKKNVADCRESPAIKLIDLLVRRGACVQYYDPLVPNLEPGHGATSEALQCVAWSQEALRAFDAAVIVTDHDEIDYEALVQSCRLVVDTRNACGQRGIRSSRIAKA